MRIERLGAASRRAAGLALGAALLAGAYAGLVRPLLALHASYDGSIAELRHKLQEYRGLAQGRADTERVLQEHKRLDAAQRYYVAERSAPLALAALQGLAKRAVEQGAGELISMQVVGLPRQDALGEVTLRVRARGDVRTLQRALHALEGGFPILFVNNLSVDASAGGELVLGFDVSGHMRVPRE